MASNDTVPRFLVSMNVQNFRQELVQDGSAKLLVSFDSQFSTYTEPAATSSSSSGIVGGVLALALLVIYPWMKGVVAIFSS